MLSFSLFMQLIAFTHFHTLLTLLDFGYVNARFHFLTFARLSVSVNEGKSGNGGFIQTFSTNTTVAHRSPAPSFVYTELEPEII